MKKLLYNVLCITTMIGGFVLADEVIKHDNKIITTVYVIRNDDIDRTIHRIFATKSAANKYVNSYKSNHNYEIENIELTE